MQFAFLLKKGTAALHGYNSWWEDDNLPRILKLNIQGCALPEAKKEEKNLAQKFIFSKQKITKKQRTYGKK